MNRLADQVKNAHPHSIDILFDLQRCCNRELKAKQWIDKFSSHGENGHELQHNLVIMDIS